MKIISTKTFAIALLAAGTLAGCTSENTTGVETEGTETQSNMESQPNMGGKTGNTATIDSVATGETDTTGAGNMQDQQ